MDGSGAVFSEFTKYDPAFGPPEQSPPLVPGPHGEPVFEIALVLNGAVSAGAYTGGVLDYLTEALDAFEAAKAVERQKHGSQYELWTIPHHHVRIRVISGASAGGMSGAMLATAHDRDFPHVHSAVDAATNGPNNPFYRPWVKRIDISGLLGTSDLPKSATTVPSLLDCTVLDKIRDETLDFPARCPALKNRNWLDGGLRLCLTITNLRGVPYQVAFPGSTSGVSFAMTRHADCQRFILPPAAGFGGGAGVPLQPRPDEFVLPPVSAPGNIATDALGTAALATASFPIALASREIKPVLGFAKSWYVTSDEPSAWPPLVCPQAWTASVSPDLADRDLAPDTYASADGGMIDNAPVELARIELAGILGRNPRGPLEAQRALIMINPFPEPPSIANFKRPEGIFKTAARLVGMYIEQARFDADDIRLAIDDDVYSRFMIHPHRKDGSGKVFIGGAALACGALGAFSGFLLEAYRRHDFLLGRKNCEGFLRDYFCLPVSVHGETPALFVGHEGPLTVDFTYWDDDVVRPIIPIIGVPATKLECWPAGLELPAGMTSWIGTRLNAVLRTLTAKRPKGLGAPGLVIWLILRLGFVRACLAKKAAAAVITQIESELKKHKLLCKACGNGGKADG